MVSLHVDDDSKPADALHKIFGSNKESEMKILTLEWKRSFKN